MKNTRIEWAHHTINFWWGCEKVSPACLHCYAEKLATLFSRGKASWGPNGRRWLRVEAALRELKRLDVPERRGERVFINSMSDSFEDRRDLDAERAVMFAALERVKYLKILLLTKRSHLVLQLVPNEWRERWPAHVWMGVTVEDQTRADERIPHLSEIPALVRFLSCEPLLGLLDIEENLEDMLDGGYVLGSAPIHWVICGGESGPKARPMHPDWARSLRDQCQAAGVPFFFKQWGEWFPGYTDHPDFFYDDAHGEPDITRRRVAVHAFPPEADGSYQEMGCIGKKAAGRLLDGREWNEFPSSSPQNAETNTLQACVPRNSD